MKQSANTTHGDGVCENIFVFYIEMIAFDIISRDLVW